MSVFAATSRGSAVSPSSTATAARAKTAKATTLFVAIVVVAVCAFGGNFVLSHRSADLRAAAAAKAAAASYSAKAERGRNVEAHAAAYQARLVAGRTAYPTRRDQAAIIDDIAFLAARTGVTWSAGQQGAAATGFAVVPGAAGSLTPYAAAISVSGTLPQVLAFVRGISSMPRAATADSLGLTWISATKVKAALDVVAWSSGGAPTPGAAGSTSGGTAG